MRIRATVARIPARVAFWAMAGVALFVSHDAVFLAHVGPGHELARALRGAGHEYWGIASLVLGLIGLVALTANLVRLRALRRNAESLGATPTGGSRPYVVRWLATWGRLLAVVAIGFLIQENIEHFIGHGHAPGLGALIGPEYPLALPVILAVTGLAALVAGALSHAEHELLAVIADAIRRLLARAPRSTPRPPMRVIVSLTPPLARAWSGRAPPRLLVSVT